MVPLAIAIGGLAGALARYGAGLTVGAWHGSLFPWATLGVNVGGSLLLGWLMLVLPVTRASPAVKAGVTVGFCGGFTTFSAFAYEAVMLARTGHAPLAGAYVAASLLLGLAAMSVGMQCGAAVARSWRSGARAEPATGRPEQP